MKTLDFKLLLKTINQLDIGTIVLNESYEIMLWSDWMVAHSGKSCDDSIDHSLLSVCPEIKDSRLHDAIINALHTGQPAVISNILNRTPFILYPKSSTKEIKARGTSLIKQALKITRLVLEDKSRYCIIQITDLSASVKREHSLAEQIKNRKKVEQALSDERALFISGPTVVITWSISPKQKINYISPNIELMLGYTEQQFLRSELDFISLIHPDDTEQYFKEVDANIKNNCMVFEQEFRLLNATGEYRWIYNLTSISRDSFGNVSRYLGYLLDITERIKYQRLVERQAYYDELTGLPNRRMFIDRLEQELDKSKRHQGQGALFFIDIDRFKSINDSLGHDIGDLLLKSIATRLKDCIRLEDIAARLGGDEFVVILSRPANEPKDISRVALTVANKIRHSLGEKHELNGNEVYSTPSIGIVTFPSQEDGNAEKVMSFADTAMYRAKNDGGNQVRFFDPNMQNRIDERLALEKSLRCAIVQKEFVLNFQPLFDNKNNIISAEALIRWQHPLKGWISPTNFIPFAEETGLILPLGEWVLRESCRQLKNWESTHGIYLSRIAVNISPKQFRQVRFVAQIKQILTEFDVQPERLIIELTEDIVIADIADTVKKMNELQSLGIRIDIDDFGTGYSSLADLNTLPIDVLKIDQSFIRNISNNMNTAIVGTIISMAEHLNLKVIAEGVETESELQFLKSTGCKMFQGYLFSKPLSADLFSKFILANNQAKSPEPLL